MHRGKTLICTLAGVALCATANAVTSESSGSPYQGIVERNVFGLKAPPPPPDPEATKPPPPKITLQGITTFGGIKRALLKAPMPPKAGEPPKGEQSFIIAEGQRDGDIEVLEIDAKAGTVKVNNFGSIATLDFEHNGIKTAAAPAPMPGAVPRPVNGMMPPPGASPTPFTPTGGAPSFPLNRPTRLPLPNGAAASPAFGGATPVYATGNPGMAAGAAAMPLFNPAPAQTQPVAQPAVADTMTAEQKFLLIEAYRAKMKQSGQDLMLPPIPPTPLTQELNPTKQGSAY